MLPIINKQQDEYWQFTPDFFDALQKASNDHFLFSIINRHDNTDDYTFRKEVTKRILRNKEFYKTFPFRKGNSHELGIELYSDNLGNFVIPSEYVVYVPAIDATVDFSTCQDYFIYKASDAHTGTTVVNAALKEGYKLINIHGSILIEMAKTNPYFSTNQPTKEIL